MFSLLLRALHTRGLVPRMSETERIALEAGDVWVDGDLFSGRPDFRRLLAEPYPSLSPAEGAFLAGPVEEVCALVDPQQVARTKVLPPAAWDCLRAHRFFGLGLPARYGGHDFSALGMSTIFGTLVSHSLTLSTVVLIPNSVGPGELLLEVGTARQREHYLPRLARGDEIPCFALTEPTAGSDAAALESRGVVFRNADGALRIRLDWEKRYITLAPIATLIGLAFRLYDPEGLLGGEVERGISCALVPADLPGVEIGRHHDPMGLPFPNGPIVGRGVEIDVGQLIGGPELAGRGWQMLMEALAGGRAISLPAQAVAGAKKVARICGAYGAVRRQFGLPIGRFEGVEEPLARIGGLAYLLEAARVYTCGAVMAGKRPSVISALMKYNSTEMARGLVRDGMDVLGGAGICKGPRNLLADGYIGAPIGITVEGANILTRTLIVFGQGAMRCHPHAHTLLEAMRRRDARAFRRALGGMLWRFMGNGLRGLALGLSRGRLAGAPVGGPTAPYYRRLAWAACRFAFYTDLAMMLLGSRLKTRGKLSGRFADLLSWLYLATATLRRFEAEGRREEDLPLVHWGLRHCLAQLQEAYEGLLRNFDAPLIGWWLRGPVLAWARLNPMGSPPSDRLGARVARLLQKPGAQRDRLTAGIYLPPDPEAALQVLESAFTLSAASAPLEAAIRTALRNGTLAVPKTTPAGRPEAVREAAVAAGVLSAEQAALLAGAEQARARAIAVDSFTFEEYAGRAPAAVTAIVEQPAAVAG